VENRARGIPELGDVLALPPQAGHEQGTGSPGGEGRARVQSKTSCAAAWTSAMDVVEWLGALRLGQYASAFPGRHGGGLVQL
jgi:hypothetical protein